MRKRLAPSRGVQLSQPLLDHLNLYALGATAAGVGMLACAQPAEARIIYTPTHVSIRYLPLDLNNDGKADLYFQTSTNATSFAGSRNLAITRYYGPQSNGVVASPHFKATALRVKATALRAGDRIGPQRKFQGFGGLATVVHRSQSGNSTFKWYGRWGNNGKGLKNRYLGLRFVINGKLHYGWARVSIFVDGRSFSPPPLLTGYAYETIPNKPIVAGAEKSQDLITAQPATLGHLAAGATAISSWRANQTSDYTQH